jgi:hypothetical protein
MIPSQHCFLINHECTRLLHAGECYRAASQGWVGHLQIPLIGRCMMMARDRFVRIRLTVESAGKLVARFCTNLKQRMDS